jgi:hypothetical protein
MSDAVIAALVAGAVSLAVTFGKIVWDDRRERQIRRVALRQKLDTYREPLLAAVDDLGDRINNIRNDDFLIYLNVEGRQRIALLGTLFRFAQLFGWTEALYGNFGRLRFENDMSTKAVGGILRNIGRTLAVDRLDRADASDFMTTQLMIWREEQRRESLELQQLLADLVRELDVDQVLVKVDAAGVLTEPRWATPARLPSDGWRRHAETS